MRLDGDVSGEAINERTTTEGGPGNGARTSSDAPAQDNGSPPRRAVGAAQDHPAVEVAVHPTALTGLGAAEPAGRLGDRPTRLTERPAPLSERSADERRPPLPGLSAQLSDPPPRLSESSARSSSWAAGEVAGRVARHAARGVAQVPVAGVHPNVALGFSDVTVRRGSAVLLDQVSWQVEVDQRWVVLGPNGAGKTTLLMLAAARLHPTSGTVHLLGELLGRVAVSDVRPLIGLATAALAERLPPGELVRDVVITAAYAVIGRARERYEEVDAVRAAALLAQIGVAHLAGREYGTLSEGERKRVLIARALMTDPEVLLLDEPAAALDLGGREDLVRLLAGLAGDPSSPALVVVTHHVEEIPPGFTHALLLAGGKVVAHGPIDSVITSSNLTTAFGQPLVVERRDGRYAARGEHPVESPVEPAAEPTAEPAAPVTADATSDGADEPDVVPSTTVES
jgi:iron complex transport system ATP-binding protein